MKKLSYSEKKSMRLLNVLKYKIPLEDEDINLNIIIEQMQTYIKAKGAKQIGPLIQFTKAFQNRDNELDMEITLMLQCSNYIHNGEIPYMMESVIHVVDAPYCRYVGPEVSLKFAYDKISIEAFEKGISLSDNNYIIFVDRNEEDETIVADVFIPRRDEK